MSDKPAQDQLFGEAPPATAQRIRYPAKIDELQRELRMRQNLYPKWTESGKLDPKVAARQLAILESIIEDYNVRPWPQLRDFVIEWRDTAETVTFCGVRVTKMHREELMAVVAYAKNALEAMATEHNDKGETP